MEDSKMIQKIKPFLIELKDSLENNKDSKFFMSPILKKYKLSTTALPVLLSTEIIKKDDCFGYLWTSGEVNDNTCLIFLESRRRLQKHYADKYKSKLKPNHQTVLRKKTQDFLNEIYTEIVVKGNEKLKIRQLLIKHGMSDSSRKALFDLGIISNKGETKNRIYKWLVGKPDTELFNQYLDKIKEINKIQKSKQQQVFVDKIVKELPHKKSNHIFNLGILALGAIAFFNLFKKSR